MKNLYPCAVFLALVSCVPATTVERQSCLLEAEAHAQARADKECHEKEIGWSVCDAREDIMAELTKAHEACR